MVKPLYTVAETAALLGKSKQTVYRAIEAGDLSTEKLAGVVHVTLASLQRRPALWQSIRLAYSLNDVMQLDLPLERSV